MTEPLRLDSSPASRRELFTLTLLTGLAIVMFLVVTGLSHLFEAQQNALAARWAARGTASLQAHQFAPAAAAFRAALRYDRDSYPDQLNLAQALLGMNRSDEADAYLVNLWDREPENGFVNLELARIAAGKGMTANALRYYHNAVYAIWPEDQEAASRNARLELVGYLLAKNADTQAQAELIVLAANTDADSPEQERLGELFLRANDSQHALATFRIAIKYHPHDEKALAGAGVAAFQLGLYPAAHNYFESALAIAPGDEQSAAWMKKTDAVLELDPYRQQIPVAERARTAANAFAVAGDRLKACTAHGNAAAAQNFAQQWTKLEPQATEEGLRRDPDLIDTTMDLAISIERGANGVCGPVSENDSALLLIANLHEEN